jgi:hypothetical protein
LAPAKGSLHQRASNLADTRSIRGLGPSDVRLYLSSFRLGAHPDRLLRLSAGRRAALIPNALDGLPAKVREVSVRRDVADLAPLGLQVSEIDLRDADAARRLAAVDIVWVRGGNVFALRRCGKLPCAAGRVAASRSV